jgi:hypothetical protein
VTDLFERLDRNRPAPESKPVSKPSKDPAQRLLNWLGRWSKDTVCTKDILQFGPNSLRKPKSAIDAAETLVRNGWLTPAKLHRYDMRKWHIVRKPIIPPTVAT